jgi:hypothetical protein
MILLLLEYRDSVTGNIWANCCVKNSETPRVSHEITDQDVYFLCAGDSKRTE